MRRADVDKFEKLVVQVQGVYEELSLLSRKNPNDAINKFKLRFINTVISESNAMLGDKYRPFQDFVLFSEDDVPQNSDAVFILAQYLGCFEKLRSDHVIQELGTWYWTVTPEKGEQARSDGFVHIRTVQPKRLKE